MIYLLFQVLRLTGNLVEILLVSIILQNCYFKQNISVHINVISNKYLTMTIFQAMKSASSLNILIFLKVMIFMLPALGWLYVKCYFGDEVTYHFGAIDESINQCTWYLFPLEMQQFLPMMIILAQKPVYVGEFGKIHCTRTTYKNVSFHFEYICSKFVVIQCEIQMNSFLDCQCRILLCYYITNI